VILYAAVAGAVVGSLDGLFRRMAPTGIAAGIGAAAAVGICFLAFTALPTVLFSYGLCIWAVVLFWMGLGRRERVACQDSCGDDGPQASGHQDNGQAGRYTG